VTEAQVILLFRQAITCSLAAVESQLDGAEESGFAGTVFAAEQDDRSDRAVFDARLQVEFVVTCEQAIIIEDATLENHGSIPGWFLVRASAFFKESQSFESTSSILS